MRRDVEPLRDFLVAQSLADQLDHFALASRHAHVLEQSLAAAAFAASAICEKSVSVMRGGSTLSPAATARIVGDKLVKGGVLEYEPGTPAFTNCHDILVRRHEIHDDDLRAARRFADLRATPELSSSPSPASSRTHVGALRSSTSACRSPRRRPARREAGPASPRALRATRRLSSTMAP
jgi:hypothetical protein